jgi:DNA-directed RNA polymerase sigma subunit (sigma70/sigma32)
MDPKANGAFRGPTAAEEARTREEVRRRLAATRERARQRHEQTLHRLAGLLQSSKPA